MHPMLNIAVRAVRKAGQCMVQAYEQQIQLPHLPGDSAPVCQAIAQVMVAVIQRSYPQHTIVNTLDEPLDSLSEVQWLIEPLAGKTNFSKRLPHCALSITVLVKAVPEIAVIYDALRNELFTAVRGSGAQLNGYRLRMASRTPSLAESVLATSFMAHAPQLLGVSMRLLGQGAAIRCSGCTVLDLAYVAAGRMDAFFGRGVGAATRAAGALVISEAGGLVADFSGAPRQRASDEIVAAPTKMMKSLLNILQRPQALQV